ncbi:pilus assembly protein TadG-related protein [Limimaricola litoreus]|uniref:Pilus assembly protein TadG-related protein n=1 Tax=Limimaricola litoreus TaxID=2955316 RepID=A0A9X2FNN7_9RHOB|nr:pilus assembly protein TadG-related protein [Limimaricola litoreus]MCP1168152.1 pilus assembly protein TadG-related protein [Limimaricola litoreus]
MPEIPRLRPRPHAPPGIGRNEDGSIVIFSLFTFVIMLALGGLGIDTMRTESRRVDLQSTLDRAVLAAADLQQTRDPEAVVRDYFAKAGYPADLPRVTVIDALNSRTVRASASLPVSTSFLRILGIDSFDAPAVGSATESVSDVEIGLVLDVSGSMDDNNRLPRLKTAGKDFIDTMFENIEPEHIAISLVPYSTQVNIGADLAAAGNVATTHGHSYCIDLPASAYTTTRASTGALVQAGHFDVEGFSPTASGRWISGYNGMNADTPNCRNAQSFEVLPWSNRPRTLKNRIDALSAKGWTSVEMGVNWGTALLDPAAGSALTAMIDRNKVDPNLAGWPRDFDSPVGMKVLVVMTDGANTYDFRIKPPYNGDAPSDVWLYGSDEYVVKVNQNAYFRAKTRELLGALPHGGTRLSWSDLFSRMSVRQHAYHLRVQQHDASTYRQAAWAYWTSIIEHEGVTEKNRRLKQICAAAREQGIVIFTIGFEIDQPGAVEAMADCASSPSHFYRVEGLEISTAFTSIATQIKALRLVQ